MNISLDFDDTYTRDPTLWNVFIQDCIVRGHTVYIVTMRTPEQGEEVMKSAGTRVGESRVYFTSMQSKRNYMWKQGIKIDVWIDDMPDAITRGIDTDVNDGVIIL
jgi:hypothetical protein